MLGAISEKFRTFGTQINFAPPPIPHFRRWLGAFSSIFSKLRYLYHFINQLVRKVEMCHELSTNIALGEWMRIGLKSHHNTLHSFELLFSNLKERNLHADYHTCHDEEATLLNSKIYHLRT